MTDLRYWVGEFPGVLSTGRGCVVADDGHHGQTLGQGDVSRA